MPKTTKKIRKPSALRTRNIYAETVVEENGRRTVRFFDRGSVGMFSDVGVTVPSNEELTKFMEWLKAARAWSRQRNIGKENA